MRSGIIRIMTAVAVIVSAGLLARYLEERRGAVIFWASFILAGAIAGYKTPSPFLFGGIAGLVGLLCFVSISEKIAKDTMEGRELFALFAFMIPVCSFLAALSAWGSSVLFGKHWSS